MEKVAVKMESYISTRTLNPAMFHQNSDVRGKNTQTNPLAEESNCILFHISRLKLSGYYMYHIL